jgi:hypothetical protein
MEMTQAGQVLHAMKHTAADMANVNKLAFDFTDSRVEQGRFLSYVATWGAVERDEINNAGLSVEFAGPTSRRKTTHILPKFKPQMVTNVSFHHRTIRGSGDRIKGKLHALADASHMPFRDASIGSVHISCLPSGNNIGLAHGAPLREQAITEAERTLKGGGYLVWDGGNKNDYDRIVAHGLQPMALRIGLSMFERNDGLYEGPTLDFNGVFQKPVQHT